MVQAKMSVSHRIMSVNQLVDKSLLKGDTHKQINGRENKLVKISENE